MSSHTNYGVYQRRSFCGDGISFKIVCSEYGADRRVREGRTFERQITEPNIIGDMPEEEILRNCLELLYKDILKIKT